MSPKSIALITSISVAIIIGFLIGGSIVETNYAGFIKVKQAAITGELTVYTEPGMFWQLFGDITEYKIEDTLWFSKHRDEGGIVDESIPVRFNDGAEGRISGSVRFTLPLDSDHIIKIHKRFRGFDNLKFQLIKQVVQEAVILTAALMSAEESYTTKRAAFSELAWDQVLNGIYLTEREEIEKIDPKTGEKTVISRVKIKRDKNGNPVRKANPLKKFNIKLSAFVIKDIDYEEGVRKLIAAKRQYLMETVAARAKAEKAVQERLTAEEEGKKNVMIAKYEKEVEKQKAVIEAQKEKEVALIQAQKEKEVAKLRKEAAELEKERLMLLGEGEAARRRKIMMADGALDKRLKAWIEVNRLYAEAIKSYQGSWVPKIFFGNNGQEPNMAQNLINLLTVKTAQDLALSPQVVTTKVPKPKPFPPPGNPQKKTAQRGR